MGQDISGSRHPNFLILPLHMRGVGLVKMHEDENEGIWQRYLAASSHQPSARRPGMSKDTGHHRRLLPATGSSVMDAPSFCFLG